MIAKLTLPIALLLSSASAQMGTWKNGYYCAYNEIHYTLGNGQQSCMRCPDYTHSYYDSTVCQNDYCPSGYYQYLDGRCGMYTNTNPLGNTVPTSWDWSNPVPVNEYNPPTVYNPTTYEPVYADPTYYPRPQDVTARGQLQSVDPAQRPQAVPLSGTYEPNYVAPAPTYVPPPTYIPPPPTTYVYSPTYYNPTPSYDYNPNWQYTYCPANQIYSTDGTRCLDCGSYARPMADQSYCYYDVCSSSQKLDINGYCVDCVAGTQASGDGRNCLATYVAPTCGSRQVFSSSGTVCTACPSYTRAQNGNSFCAADSCLPSEYVTVDGTCAPCGPGYYVTDGRTCNSYVSPTCGSNQILLGDMRNCQTCPDFSRPQDNARYCAPDACASNQIVNRDGTCGTCPMGTSIDQMQRQCVVNVRAPIRTPTCGVREIISSDGRRCEVCPPYTKAFNSNTRCMPDRCDAANQFVDVTGSCGVCTGGTVVDSLNRGCVTPKPVAPVVVNQCAAFDQYRKSDGTCGQCPDGNVADAANTSCVPMINNNNRDRVINCSGSREMVSSDGNKCFFCPTYTRAQANNTKCGPDTCTTGQVLTVLGSCTACASGTVPDSSGRNCVPAPATVSLTALNTESAAPQKQEVSAQNVNDDAAFYKALAIIFGGGIVLLSIVLVVVYRQNGKQTREAVAYRTSEIDVSNIETQQNREAANVNA